MLGGSPFSRTCTRGLVLAIGAVGVGDVRPEPPGVGPPTPGRSAADHSAKLPHLTAGVQGCRSLRRTCSVFGVNDRPTACRHGHVLFRSLNDQPNSSAAARAVHGRRTGPAVPMPRLGPLRAARRCLPQPCAPGSVRPGPVLHRGWWMHAGRRRALRVPSPVVEDDVACRVRPARGGTGRQAGLLQAPPMWEAVSDRRSVANSESPHLPARLQRLKRKQCGQAVLAAHQPAELALRRCWRGCCRRAECASHTGKACVPVFLKQPCVPWRDRCGSSCAGPMRS